MSFSTSADNSQATRSATRVPPDEVCTKREAALRRWRGQDNEVDGGIVPPSACEESTNEGGR